jgi:NCAIR mutase (PurE)-related protein
MLQACSMGIAVVNIDNGIAAGVVASSIARRSSRDQRDT